MTEIQKLQKLRRYSSISGPHEKQKYFRLLTQAYTDIQPRYQLPAHKRRLSQDVPRKYRKQSFSILSTIIHESQMEAEKNDNEYFTEQKIKTENLKNKTKILKDINGNKTTSEDEALNDTKEHKAPKSTKYTGDDIIKREDFDSTSDYIKALRQHQNSNKLYASKKHHSDYDVINLHPHMHDLMGRRKSEGLIVEHCNENDLDSNKKNFSKSDSNLSLDPNHVTTSLPPSGRMKKSSSHKDITGTAMYKEIYADNLRQYGFLLAKQLGTSNKSPDQLRKTYLNNRLKAAERRERAQTTHEDRQSSIESPLMHRKTSHGSLPSNGHLEHSKYSGSLTDISVVGLENDIAAHHETHRRPQSAAVIRRKQKQRTREEAKKRLSAPLLHTIKLEIDIDSDENINNLPPSKSSSLTSLNVPEHTYSSGSDSGDSRTSSTNDVRPRRKISVESQRRHDAAHIRLQKRQSDLDSFSDMLSQANQLMKDLRKRSIDVSKESDT